MQSKLLVLSSNYFIEYLIFLECKREHEFFVVQRTGKAADTSGVGQARMYACPDLWMSHPTETNPTPARSSTSSVSALRSSARLPWSVTCTSCALRRTTRATRARPYIANASRACVSDVALLCFHPCVGLDVRVRAPARGVSSHTRVFFATCTYQFTIHLITNEPYHTHTHVRPKHRTQVPTSNRVVLHEARRHAHSSLPRDRHDATSYHAFARDTKPHRLAQHKASHQGRVAHEYLMLQGLVFRLNVGPNAPMRAVLVSARDARTDTNALFTMCAHPVGYIDEAPLHYPQTMPSTRVT